MMKDFSTFLMIFLGVLALLAYFIPAMIAISKQHANAMAIFLTNLLLGWTLIGWIFALIWSFTAAALPASAAHPPHHLSRPLKFTVMFLSLVILLLMWSKGTKETVVYNPITPPKIKTGVPVPADELFGK